MERLRRFWSIDDGILPMLHVAVLQGSRNAVWFHSHLRQPNVVSTKTKRTALHYAALYGQLDIVEILCEAPNIDVNTVDCDGASALSLAIEHNHMGVVEFLLGDKRIGSEST